MLKNFASLVGRGFSRDINGALAHEVP